MPRSEAAGVEPDPAFEELLEFLRDNRGFDFTGYKRASLQRRIARRMAEVGISGYTDYLDHLELHPDEFTALFNTILINVTGFFRDPDAWEHLRAEILPGLVAGKRPTEPLRVWSAGTASGEEAYSIAMLLAEVLDAEQFRDRVKIYATDIDEEALAHARVAAYDAREVAAVPEPLRERFFEPQNGRFALRKDFRRAVIFGRNDLIQEAPISRVDLLICRNTLMYFNAETQDRVLRRFHFSLTDNGVLFLGKAETLLTQSRQFRPLDLRRRFFRRVPGPPEIGFPARGARGAAVPAGARDSLADLALDLVPGVAALVLADDGTVVHANAAARSMLGLEDRDLGRPLRELDASLRPVDLRPLLDRVEREGTVGVLPDVEWTRRGEEPRHFEVSVVPLQVQGARQGAVVFFIDTTTTSRLQADLIYANKQLETSYEELQSTVEELETTNEELQSTNEELETTNEELQSTNDELHSANEELQSTNDELQSANEELSERSAEVIAANAFMDSILRSLDAAVIVIDPELTVTAWSARADDLWGVRPQEAIGQHLLNLDIGLSLDALYPVVRRVLTGSSPREQLELAAVNRRGRAITVQIGCTALTGDGGDLSGAILFVAEMGQAP